MTDRRIGTEQPDITGAEWAIIAVAVTIFAVGAIVGVIAGGLF